MADPFRPKWFHLRDGLYFARGENDTVLIKKNATAEPGALKLFQFQLTESEWGSINDHIYADDEPQERPEAEDVAVDNLPEDDSDHGL